MSRSISFFIAVLISTSLLTLLSTHQAQACSLADDAAYVVKNDLLKEFFGHPSLQVTFDNVLSLKVGKYKADFFYTFPDQGADCPDSIRLTAEITTKFKRPIRYNVKKSAQIFDRVNRGEITWEQAERLLKKIETCRLRASAKSEKIPDERGANPPYITLIQLKSPMICSN